MIFSCSFCSPTLLMLFAIIIDNIALRLGHGIITAGRKAIILKQGRTIFITVVLIAVLGIASFAYIRLANTPSTLASQLNSLALTGTIMGAAMAAAGVIVTLVSIYSLYAIETRVKQEFDKWANGLGNSEAELANKRFKAFDLAARATQTDDLEQAEIITNEAISLYELLPNARRRMGLRYYESAYRTFVVKERLDLIQSAFATTRLGYNNAPTSTDYSAEAKEWLQKALKASEDTDGQVSYALAVLYAMQGRLDKVKEYLTLAAAVNLDCRPPDYIMKGVFLHACNTENDIQSLNEWLQWEAPITKDTLMSEIPKLSANSSRKQNTLLCVRKRNSIITDGPGRVFYLYVQQFGEDKYILRWHKAVEETNASYVWFPNQNGEGALDLEGTLDYIKSICWVVSVVKNPLNEN